MRRDSRNSKRKLMEIIKVPMRLRKQMLLIL